MPYNRRSNFRKILLPAEDIEHGMTASSRTLGLLRSLLLVMLEPLAFAFKVAYIKKIHLHQQ